MVDMFLCFKISVFFILMILFLGSCADFLEVPNPDTQLVRDKVFEDDATALAAMLGVYYKLSNDYSFSDGDEQSVTVYMGLYSDELISYIPVGSESPNTQFYLNDVSSDNKNIQSTWARCYSIIYDCNSIIEGLSKSVSVSQAVKNQLEGESLFIRAFCHFYLTNLFGNVPLILDSDYLKNASVSRTDASRVYEYIISDLIRSKSLLIDSYPSKERVRVNRGATIALLSRVYLYIGDYSNAEIQATEIIDNQSQYSLLKDLDSVFLRDSKEAIWQLLPKGGVQKYTNEAALFILVAPPSRFSISNELINSFEGNDFRRKRWVDSITSTSGLTKWYYSVKYKERQSNAAGSEYSMVLRLAEQYLIRAESRLKQNKIEGADGAISDLNVVRARAGLKGIEFSNDGDLLNAILHERRVELFLEWGHRFFDLRRGDRLDSVKGGFKSGWSECKAWLPIPKSEILININLNPQNLCY